MVPEREDRDDEEALNGRADRALRQVESGTKVTELCRTMGISQQTFYTWRKKYA